MKQAIKRSDVREALKAMGHDEVVEIAATTGYLWWSLESVFSDHPEPPDFASVLAVHDSTLTFEECQNLLVQAAGALEGAVLKPECN